jgi:hypothetical protein
MVIQHTDGAKRVMREIERIQNSVRTRLLKGIDPEDLSTCMAVFAKILVNLDNP